MSNSENLAVLFGLPHIDIREDGAGTVVVLLVKAGSKQHQQCGGGRRLIRKKIGSH